MKAVFRKIFSLLLALMTFVMMLNFTSCDKENKKADSFICKKSDFEKIQDKIYKNNGYDKNVSGEMINSKALKKSVKKLIEDEKYYFVFVLYVGKNSEIPCSVDFKICDVSGIYCGAEAVTFGSVIYDKLSHITFTDKGQGNFSVCQETGAWLGWNYTYVAVEFTPKRSGTLLIDSSTESAGIYTDMSATVFDSTKSVSEYSEAVISNLAYKISSRDGKTIFAVNFDMDITGPSDKESNIYCVIHIYSEKETGGPWDTIEISSANTANFTFSESEYGKIIFFSYSADSAEKKSSEILLEFESIQDIVIDTFITGDCIYVGGTLYKRYTN